MSKMMKPDTTEIQEDVLEFTSEKTGIFAKLRKFFSVKRIIILSVILIVALVTVYFLFIREEEVEVTTAYSEYIVEKGSVTDTIEQSGVIEPYERYEITSRVMGEIIASPFEEGDFVEEGETLYQIDDEDAQLNIEKADNNISKSQHNIEKADNSITRAENNIVVAQNNVEKAQKALDDVNKEIAKLNIYATASGRITDFSLKNNDNVSPAVIAKIVNTDVRTIDIPFFNDDFSKISIGDSVTLTSALHMESIPGVVTHKYESQLENGSGSGAQKKIEIQLSNPKSIDSQSTFAAVVHTGSGNVSSAASGAVKEGDSTSVRAETNGTVSEVLVKNGDYVQKGQLIAKMTNDDLISSRTDCERTLKERQLSLNEAKMSHEESEISLSDSKISLADSKLSKKSTEKALDDYNITAPISGTIITKNSKVGDNINNSSGQTVMMVVADMSKMKFTITVDELDISEVHEGQTAIVDADALPDEIFKAEVTSVASEGVSTGNGVTTFEVELTINEPGNLKPGMNVNANIVIHEAHDVIVIPEDALNRVRGTSAMVMVKSAQGEKPVENVAEKAPKPDGEGTSPVSKNAVGFGGQKNGSGALAMPNGAAFGGQKNFGGAAPAADNTAAPNGTFPNSFGGLPEDVEMREVEIGVSDGEYIEVKSGLSIGETIVYIPSTASTGDDFARMMQGMMSRHGMSGGGMMGGGMSGNRMPGVR